MRIGQPGIVQLRMAADHALGHGVMGRDGYEELFGVPLRQRVENGEPDRPDIPISAVSVLESGP